MTEVIAPPADRPVTKMRDSSRSCNSTHARDHLADRQRLALPAPRVGGRIPVEAQVVIVRAVLLGIEQREAMALGKLGPAAARIIARRILGAAVKHHHQRARRAQGRRGHRTDASSAPGLDPNFASGARRRIAMAPPEVAAPASSPKVVPPYCQACACCFSWVRAKVPGRPKHGPQGPLMLQCTINGRAEKTRQVQNIGRDRATSVR